MCCTVKISWNVETVLFVLYLLYLFNSSLNNSRLLFFFLLFFSFLLHILQTNYKYSFLGTIILQREENQKAQRKILRRKLKKQLYSFIVCLHTSFCGVSVLIFSSMTEELSFAIGLYNRPVSSDLVSTINILKKQKMKLNIHPLSEKRHVGST